MDIAAWLRGLGLEQYARAFVDNDISDSVLPSLTAEDLRELGVASVGHRRRLLNAIAALRAESEAPPSTDAAPPLVDATAERRQLTVLFCDLIGSTALSARLDPEDLRGVLAAYQRRVAEVMQAHGGYVAQYMGDGVLAYFGWPRAHEDDVERAVRAGLAVAAAVAALPRPAAGAAAEPLAARVGVATGPAVVGEFVGEGPAQERSVVGETPNLAARLQSLARPGTVVACSTTRRLTGTLFDWEDLGKQPLKGLPALVRPWRALGEGTTESRFEALRGGAAAAETPLLGRQEELELLLRRWAQAKRGEGCVVLLSGEPGIGKSRLVAALQQAVAAEPHEDLVWFCSPHQTDSALHPVVTRLERAAGFGRGDAAEVRHAKLEALLARGEPTPEEIALIADLLAVPTGGGYPALESLSPRRRRERTLTALLRRVEALSRRQPVLAVLEDAHWADPTTRELLDLLAARVPELPVLLIVTHRPEF